jgi:LuxR family maltose regulon positive regulatory protein
VSLKGEDNGAPGPIIVDALSPRETEVLRHLADLLTTEEVAATMFVSVNTVKSHIRSILRKLSVSRRNEAIRRARELQVI